MLKIPYGESGFSKVIKSGYFYQDRTAFIHDLEAAPQFLFYLRPRRFGKSLFVTMLHYYYALEYKEQFNDLFGKLAIGENPTASANQYMVISFEFTGIQTNTPANTMEGFLESVRDSVGLFLHQYDDIFPPDIHESIVEKKQPNLVMKALFYHYNRISKTRKIPQIYLLIDEYDHFTNELISFNFDFFAKSVTENGFVRKFYETIKTATRDESVGRLFITGVSPVTLDSMTSGFNIGTNLSLHPHFHSMMGFEEHEVRAILKGIGVKKADLTTVLTDLRVWYDGYLFHPDAKSHVYNPDMVLYFAVYYQSTKKYPDDMLDTNIATDYTKIRNLFKIQQREDQHLDTLSILMDTGEISAVLSKEFSLVKHFQQSDLVSLLFYMGFLTIKAKELGGLIFSFPNYVIEKLYADYFMSMVEEKTGLPIDNSKLNAALRALALSGTPQYLYTIVGEVVKVLSTRDSKDFNEMSLKAIFVSLLHQQQFYYVHSEFETQRQYVDVFLETVTGNPVKYEAAFELKYVKKSEVINVKIELDKAEIQLMNYMVTKKFNQRPNLKAFVVLVHGTELHQREMTI